MLAYLSETVSYGAINAVLKDGQVGKVTRIEYDDTFVFVFRAGPGAEATEVDLDDIDSVELSDA